MRLMSTMFRKRKKPILSKDRWKLLSNSAVAAVFIRTRINS